MEILQNRSRFYAVAGIILIAACFRLLPHWPNFTPIAALALFGGAYLNRRWLAFLIPIAAMLLSDLILGFHSSMWAVYSAFILTIFIGRQLKKKAGAGNVVAASLTASTLFFLITNFSVWLIGPMYPPTFAGLIASYVAGLPFFLNGIAGDLFYSGILFGAYSIVKQYLPAVNPTS